MITYEYIQELSKLSKNELKKTINEMPEKEAKEFLLAILCTTFGHYRMTLDEIAKLL